MFNNLSGRLTTILQNLRGHGRLTEENIKDTLREIRISLLEADVALTVVKQFIEDIRIRAIGQEVIQSLTPGQALVKIVHDELIKLLGSSETGLNLASKPPAIILMAGLQGSGKTTTAAKLAYWLKTQAKKSVMVTSTDIYRPAAIDQLHTLAREIDVIFHSSNVQQQPVAIVQSAISSAEKQFIDVLIVDTAGRLHVDNEMMAEIRAIYTAANPIETLFVVDSMTGQDAVNTAKAFNDALPLTGIVLTKADGDARGGAALSMRMITGKPIKFIGVGEKTTALEIFYPDRMASRILGMGDILSLVEEAERHVDKQHAEKIVKKIKTGKSFDLEDFRDQLKQLGKMGGIGSLLEKLPGAGMLPSHAKDQINDKMFIQIEAIINSMTPQERRYPDIIRGSRKRRIATGSGTQVQDINRLLKQFTQMQKMMKRFSKNRGLMQMLKGIG